VRPAALLFLIPALAAPLAAQERATSLEAFLPAEHWSRHALRRLAGIGAVAAGDAIGAWPLARSRVRRLLEDADTSTVAAAALTRHHVRHFESEFDTFTTAPVALHGSLEAGMSAHGARLRAGRSFLEGDYSGPVDIPDDVHPAFDASASLRLMNRLVLAAALRDTAGDVHIHEAYAALRAGPLLARAGRISFGLGGASNGGDFVLDSPPPFDGAVLELPEGFGLPRPIGRVRASLLVSRMARSGDIEHPWFLAARVTFAPADNFVWGLQRAIIFGGEGNEEVTVRRLLEALIGLTDTENKATNFENQMVSGDLFWKLPDRPVSVHAIWATDDAGQAFINVPAVVIGADWHVLPFAPSLGAGVDVSIITPQKATYPPWYIHRGLGDGWTDRGTPLGHPLGGHGRELLLTVQGSGTNIEASGRFFVRKRGRFNLFAPDLEGNSVGVGTDGTFYAAGPLRLGFRLDAERHARAGWTWSGGITAGVSALAWR